ncbi:MAG: hypothetical protein ABSG72_24125 [Candidatus Sulfotelmatobacter sp.]
MALRDGYKANYGDGRGLNENYASESLEGCNQQKRYRPNDTHFPEIHGAEKGAAPPHRRKHGGNKQENDEDKQVRILSWKILKAARSFQRLAKQTQGRQAKCDLNQRNERQTRNRVRWPGAVEEVKRTQPEKGSTENFLIAFGQKPLPPLQQGAI